MNKPPCYLCTKRHARCHANCDEYAAFKTKRVEYLQNIAQQKKDNDIFTAKKQRVINKRGSHK